MKTFGWFITGIVGGLALGHVLVRTPTGRAVFDEVDSRSREFFAGVRDGFEDRTSTTHKPAA